MIPLCLSHESEGGRCTGTRDIGRFDKPSFGLSLCFELSLLARLRPAPFEIMLQLEENSEDNYEQVMDCVHYVARARAKQL